MLEAGYKYPHNVHVLDSNELIILPILSNSSVMANYQSFNLKYLIINLIVTFFLVYPRTDSLIMHISLNLTKLLTPITATLTSFAIFYPLALLTVVLAIAFVMSRPQPVYLIDFTCYRPSNSFRFPFHKFMHHTQNIPDFESASIEFQEKILQRSGLGDDTALPPSHHIIPFQPSMTDSRAESELVIFSILDSLFEKTQVRAKDIDILVLNCSLFSPTPSLSAMIVNRYKMRSSIRSFNLGGMGCSAGLISIDLAQAQLRAHANSTALVVTTEIITQHWYTGNNRSMLLANCLFRMGGAAILLSNKRRDAGRSKYELAHVVRTNHCADDQAYRCVYQEEDGHGNIGVSLGKELTGIAGNNIAMSQLTQIP